jgi:Bifunctional DNA primase/polymerase, N-terminal
MNSVSTEMLDAALAYATNGWPVIPLHNPEKGSCSCGHADCDSPAKHPRTPHGLKDASSDEQIVRQWWQRWPDANIGLITGVAFDVGDLDSDAAMATFRTRSEAENFDPRILPRTKTGRGTQVFVRPTGTGNRTRIFPDCDWRGVDGYVVAPPSKHINGSSYRWVKPLTGAPPAAPAWVLQLLQPAPSLHQGAPAAVRATGTTGSYAQRALEAEVTRVLQAVEGERNDTLNRATFSLYQLVAGGELADGEVSGALERAGIAAGLSPTEVERTIASGRRRGLQEPRSRPGNGALARHTPTPPATAATKREDEAQDARREDLSALPALSAQAVWPAPLDERGYHGLAGDVVRAIDPHTEADPVAVLVGFLTAFGNVIGAGPHAVVGSTHHPTRIFAALVGETARARKGDSWAADRRLMAAAAPEWADGRVQGGLSSGEGLIAAVRDPVEQTDRKTGEVSVVDAGVSDKRLLVVEPELARTLRVMHRDGSTLSTILRDAWDTGALRVMTKVQLRASGAHVSALGHITVEELRRELDETSLANGFANRFLWLAVKRSKLLPEPVPFAGPKVEALAQRIRATLEFAQSVGEVERDEEARAVWREVYPHLTADRPGMLGAVLNRCEAHAVRLSLIYALLDRSAIIRRAHLQAALAVIDYVEASARFIFAGRLGDPVADAILQMLAASASKAMSRAALYDSFGRHTRRERMSEALSTLVTAGLVAVTHTETGGRPTEMVTLK